MTVPLTTPSTTSEATPRLGRTRKLVNRLPLPAALGLALASVSLAVGQAVIAFGS